MEWNEEFSNNYERIYRDSFSAQETMEQARFISNYTPKEGSVLDIPCGTGRVSVALAELGFFVHGVDLYNIPYADNDLTSKPELMSRVVFEEGDMRSYVNMDVEFDTTISLFSSFGYFNHTENVATLETLISATKITGKIIIDVRNPVKTFIEMSAHEWKVEMPNHQYKGKSTLDPLTAIQTFSYTVDGKTVNAQMRHYFLPEFVDLFKDRSCKVVEVYGDFNKNLYDPKKSSRMIIVAEKS